MHTAFALSIIVLYSSAFCILQRLIHSTARALPDFIVCIDIVLHELSSNWSGQDVQFTPLLAKLEVGAELRLSKPS